MAELDDHLVSFLIKEVYGGDGLDLGAFKDLFSCGEIEFWLVCRSTIVPQ